MRKIGLAVLMSAAMVWGMGCRIGPNQPFPAKDRFGVMAKGVEAVRTAPRGVIRLEGVRVAPPFDQRSFVYQTSDLTFEKDYYNQFVASPAELLTGEILAGLKSTGRFEQVVPPEMGLDTPYRLHVTVTRLVGDFRNSSKPGAVIAMRVNLVEVSAGGTRIIAQDVIEEYERIPSDSPEDLSRGWGRALGHVINTLAEWTSVNLPSGVPAK